MNISMIKLQTTVLASLVLMAGCGPNTPSSTSSLSTDERLTRLEAAIAKLGTTTGITDASRSNTLSTGASASPSSSSTEANPVKDVKISPETVRVKVGQTGSMDLVLLVMANDQTSVVKNFSLFTLSSSDSSIASIDSSGQIKGLKEGVAIITVKLGTVSKTVGVIVEAASASASPSPSPSPSAAATASPSPTPTPSPSASATTDPLGVKAVSVDPESYSIKVNATAFVNSILVELNDGTQGLLNSRDKVTFKSNDTSIASIDASGVIVAVAIGSTTITVTYKGVSKTFPVTVISAT